ncbi:CGI-121-domain-containing protein [Auriculariales sp. MPI-PUGE-AT-0066]|nr:CGI-121-domain-containing protein [Auriculariales sp. MPI-PUGE-AT-0066]
METWDYPALNSTVHVALLDGVRDAKRLRSRLVAAAAMQGAEGETEREAINFAFIEAPLIASTLHLQTALLYALLAVAGDTLRTKTVHSEILWALNPTNNISEAIRRFGVSDGSTRLLALRVVDTSKETFAVTDAENAIRAAVSGNLVPLSRLEEFSDWTALRKYYKVPVDLPRRRQVEIIVSTVATKAAAA